MSKTFDAFFIVAERKHVVVDFDEIYQTLCDENDGVFVDNFSDNISVYLQDLYGIDVNQFDLDVSDITALNDNECDAIYDSWQDYLEKKK